MLPIVLAPTHVRAALVGAGPLAVKRLGLLRDAGLRTDIYCPPTGDAALAEAAGDALTYRMPTAEDLNNVNVLFVAGLARDQSAELAALARSLGRLANVEDDIPHCDFHMPGIVRRGDLLLSVSTGGRGPGLARLIRKRLEALFPPEWAARTAFLGDLRNRLRDEGASPATINRAIAGAVEENGWLS